MSAVADFMTLPYVLGPLVAGAFLLIGYFIRAWLNQRDVRLAHDLRVAQDKADKFHNYFEQYYAPWVVRSENLLNSIRELAKDPSSEESLRESFFRLMRWLGMEGKWEREAGGIIFLGNLVAEALVKELLFSGIFSVLIEPPLSVTKIMIVREHADKDGNETRGGFERKLKWGPVKGIFQDEYKRWAQSVKLTSLAGYLHCFDEIMKFEINMCFKAWYAKQPRPPGPRLNLELQKVKTSLQDLEEKRIISSAERKHYETRIS